MTTTYVLYGRPGSGSFAVQVALEEIGARYQRIWVGREPADIDKLRELNPTGKVPALVLQDGTLMFESAAMLMQLALAHPSCPLAPAAGTSRHALFLQWMVFLSANVYESALRMYYPDRYSIRGEADADAIRQQGTIDFRAHLGLISRTLRPYVLGTDYSVADPYLYMLASWYVGDKAALHSSLPPLAAHAKLMLDRPAVARVETDHAQ
jgi:glutathione S-transferase